MGILANENAISSGGYQISNSLRFQSASSQYLSRTFGTATSRTTFTLNQWVKRGSLGSYQFFFDGGGSEDYIGFTNSDTIRVLLNGATIAIETSQVFRDPSAWYNILFVVDSTQATASNRMKLFINGVQVTAFGTTNYPAQNATFNFNSATSHKIGSNFATNNYFLDGYDTEIVFVDGQALTPSSFGSTDPTSGQWVAAKYTGTYGTNGFYLPFSNGTSTTTLGADSSGNSNNWTLTNFTRSAGVSDCWMYDVPSGNGGASGTQPNSNYAVLNALAINGGDYSTGTVSGSNLIINSGAKPSTVAPASGKFYWEVTIASSGTPSSICGIDLPSNFGANTGKYQSWVYDGTTFVNYSRTGVVLSTWAVNDVLMFALDIDSGKMYVGKNGTWQNSANPSAGTSPNFTFTASQAYNAVVGAGTASANANFGQRSFAYTPPTGFKALCTANLPVATIKQGNKYMDATLWTGTGVAQNITNAGAFKPDLVWIKNRNSTQWNNLHNSVVGANATLYSNATNAEASYATSVTAFNSNGFGVGTDADGVGVNTNTNTYVGWQWQAGQGTTSSNTNGSITSTTSVNATAGFSVVTYTGTGANATVGHGLGVAPSMVIFKKRNTAVTAGSDWAIYHVSLGATKAISLNLTSTPNTNSVFFNNTAPTSSVFSVGSANDTNISGGTYVAYCFSEISGYSKAFSYTGNGSADGTMVYCGFLPRWILIKQSSTSGNNWQLFDTARETYNPNDTVLFPNTSGAESTLNATLDFLSNGFKLRTTDGTVNTNGATYIGFAFATNPFAQSNGA